MKLKSILPLAKALPKEERRSLIDELLLVTPDDDEPLFSADDLAEFKRRSDRLGANPEFGLTWDEIKAQLLLPKA